MIISRSTLNGVVGQNLDLKKTKKKIGFYKKKTELNDDIRENKNTPSFERNKG